MPAPLGIAIGFGLRAAFSFAVQRTGQLAMTGAAATAVPKIMQSQTLVNATPNIGPMASNLTGNVAGIFQDFAEDDSTPWVEYSPHMDSRFQDYSRDGPLFTLPTADLHNNEQAAQPRDYCTLTDPPAWTPPGSTM